MPITSWLGSLWNVLLSQLSYKLNIFWGSLDWKGNKMLSVHISLILLTLTSSLFPTFLSKYIRAIYNAMLFVYDIKTSSFFIFLKYLSIYYYLFRTFREGKPQKAWSFYINLPIPIFKNIKLVFGKDFLSGFIKALHLIFW